MMNCIAIINNSNKLYWMDSKYSAYITHQYRLKLYRLLATRPRFREG